MSTGEDDRTGDYLPQAAIEESGDSNKNSGA